MAATFQRSPPLPVSRQEAFSWHQREGASDRLIPPWEDVTIVNAKRLEQLVMLCRKGFVTLMTMTGLAYLKQVGTNDLC